MAWPSKTIGRLYSRIYSLYQTNSFDISSISSLVNSDLQAKVYLFRMKKLGWLYRFQPAGRGFYRLHDPRSCFLISTGELKNIMPFFTDGPYSGLLALYADEARSFKGLKSLVLFGSVARGEASLDKSDVDILGIFDSRVHATEALDKTGLLQLRGEIFRELSYLETFNVKTGISLLPMTERQFFSHPFFLLDAFSDGRTIFDEELLFENESAKLRRDLERIGARRIQGSSGERFWDLMPNYRKGDEITV